MLISSQFVKPKQKNSLAFTLRFFQREKDLENITLTFKKNLSK